VAERKQRRVAGATKARFTPAVEDYLKEIYALQAAGEATTSTIAKRMGVAPSSVTSMQKKLAASGLAEHVPYHGVVLTKAGEQAAVEVIRHHRLLEQYLAEALGLPIEAVHAEADRLEHALSEELEAQIDKALGYPSHDPHGDPIPSADLVLAQRELRPLSALAEGEKATISRVPDRDPGLLRYLASLTLLPGQRVELRQAAPFGGPLTIAVGGLVHAISRELAGLIGVA
jgi:DtxR family transcriptional regulator, Mn-dependent transcriptional regulator